MSSLEKQFEDRIWKAVEECKEMGYVPGYFIQMCKKDGVLNSCKRLISADEPSEGFVKLTLKGRLDLSVESIAIEPQFRGLFSEDELEKAESRLKVT